MPETIPVIPIPTRPPAPTGLRLTDASISTFSFDWDQYTDNADLLVLTIQKGEEPEELVTDSISISSTSEFISGLEDNTTYTVRLYAEKEYRGGLRVRSLPDLQEATTQTYEPPPERVTGFGHVAVTYYTVLLHWDEPVINDGDIYNIYYATQR